mgnify:CR=1 FL=1
MMKKFLSSLLALTMILSLVIVPARATDTISGESSVTKGSQITLTAPSAPSKVTVGQTEYNVKSDAEVGYAWRSSSNSVATVSGSSTTGTVTGVAAGTATITCTMTLTYIKVAADSSQPPAVEEQTDTTQVSYNKEVTVTDPQGDFANDISIKVQGNEYKNGLKYIGDTLSADDISVTLKSSAINKYNSDFNATKTVNGKSATIRATATLKDNTSVSYDTTITVTYATGAVSIKADGKDTDPATPIVVVSNQEVALAASYVGNDSATCKWTGNGGFSQNTSKAPTWTAPESSSSSGDEYTLTCTFTDGSVEKTGTVKFKVVKDHYKAMPANGDTSFVLTPNKKSETIVTPYIQDTNPGGTAYTSGVTFDKLTITSGRDVISISGQTIRSLKSGTAKFTATVTFNGNKYTTDEYTVTVTDLDKTLSAIDNGDDASYSETALKDILADVVNAAYKRDNSVSTISASDIGTVTLASSVPTYLEFTEYRSNKTTKDFSDGVTIAAKAGYLGEKQTSFVVSARDTKNSMTHTITLTVPVAGDNSIKETVTGTSTNKEVTFTNSDYDYLYYSYNKPTYEGYFNGSKVDGFEYPVKENKTVTVPASKFNNSNKTVTLYVVGVDSKGVASTGTIEVSQKAYDIKYSVVAGESVTFSQKDFESFLEDIADDSSDYNSRKDTLELSYVKFSLPNSTREGVLYEGKSKIDRNDKVEDLDKVTFESVAKAKDTITISFTAYGKLYKDGSSKGKGKDVDYSGNVVISVVKEDIVFEVGVNSAIKLGSDKFIDFLRDSDKSYKKADLDYVTFDVGKNSAITSYFNGTGALYRYYNGSTGVNSTVSAKDEFYYNPKTSSKHYDLDDVAYVTSKFAKVGDIVYIPFTAYGTKSGQKAEGTLAIKVKQTMNFVDVRPGDYFYDSVQWAVNLDITKGTSATTFSPKQGCTRAQIVTFLWRAANSPAPRSSTNKFTDVYATTHADYMKAIIWATEQGITTGTGNGKFSPDATCTRAQIVTFLYRFKSNPAVYGSLNFSDVNKTEHAAFYNAILWAVNNKITTGYGNGIFDPNGTCNRGDAVTFLYRALA